MSETKAAGVQVHDGIAAAAEAPRPPTAALSTLGYGAVDPLPRAEQA